jgi:hypothetical protein
MIDKDLYLQKLQAQLDEWKAQADLLKAKADGAGADLQLELHKQIDVLKGLQSEAQSRFDDLRGATGEKLAGLLSVGEDKLAELMASGEEKLGELKSRVEGLVGGVASNLKSLFK